MHKTGISIVCLLFLAQLGQSQSLTGEWSGTVTQTGKTASFNYSISMVQDGAKIHGTSTSSNADGSGAAKFEVGGTFDGNLLVLQEVKQLGPENAKWCLKHIRLQYAENQGIATLEGNWEAQGCKPGSMKLSKVGSSTVGRSCPDPSGGQSAADQPPNSQFPNFPISKKFSGHLSQFDREYGFYFEMKFNEDGTGTSHIISDGEGGNATHRLSWSYDIASQRLDFQELEIMDESVPSWRWCMKSGSLFFKKEENRISLKGEWSGYIEGFDAKSGSCAPGKLYVEQPIFTEFSPPVPKPGEAVTPTIAQQAPPQVKAYEAKTKREVDVERVLEVRSKTVRIRVWDNGTVDGDVLSLFLNGEQIVKNYRVTRQKHETIVKLDKPTNFIILHALNVGSISPNTVAVSVDDGVEEQVVIISSNLDRSGAIMIKEFTVK